MRYFDAISVEGVFILGTYTWDAGCSEGPGSGRSGETNGYVYEHRETGDLTGMLNMAKATNVLHPAFWTVRVALMHKDAPGQSLYAIAIPLWVPTAVIALLCGIQLRMLRRYFFQSQSPMICRRCAYDLRAHAPGGTCPECGTPIHPPSATIVQPKEPA